MHHSLRPTGRALGGFVLVGLLFLVRYAWVFDVSWVNEDFMFLERARGSGFLDNWNFEDALGGYYRPLTRNLYFWLGLRLAGHESAAYHGVNLAVALGGLALFFLVARRMLAVACGAQAEGPALLATLLFAVHPAAGTPVAWISGIQDLLAIALGLGAMLAHLTGRRIAYPVLLAAALLAKETVIFIPAVLWLFDVCVERIPLARATQRQAGAMALVAVWAAGNRWLPWNDLGSRIHATELGRRNLVGRFDPGTVAFTLETLVLAEPATGFAWPYGALATAATIALAGGALAVIARLAWPPGAGLALLPAVVFWSLSSILPVIAVVSHFSYYAYYPALGASLAAAVLLPAVRNAGGRSGRLLLAALAVLSVASLLAAAGREHGGDHFDAHEVRRAARYLTAFRDDLARLHPAFPESARCYFWNIPAGLGFQLVERRALNVWFAVPGLEARLLSSYAPVARRRAFFFGHDEQGHLFEIVQGHPDPALAAPPPLYADALADLGTCLAQAGDMDAAVIEWQKALALDQAHPVVNANLGMVLVDRGEFAAAEPVLARAAMLAPENAEVRLYHGFALGNLGRYAAAKAEVEAYLSMTPDSTAREPAVALRDRLTELARRP